MGALDVCPFIPVQNVTMEDCVECAREFGDKLAIELGVPGMCSPESLVGLKKQNKKLMLSIRKNV